MEEYENFERRKIYGENIVSRVSQSLGKSQRTLRRAIQFARKYPDLELLPGGKSISWQEEGLLMAIFDEFGKNYELLLYLAYKKPQDYPAYIRKKKSSSGLFPRNGEAYRKLEAIEKGLYKLNNEILGFFETPGYAFESGTRI